MGEFVNFTNNIHTVHSDADEEEFDDITSKQYNEILGMDEEESKMDTLSRNALEARKSIANDLGIKAGATVDSVRLILEEILSHRLDTMRQNLIEQNKNNKLYKNQLQQNLSMENTKLNTITLQNLKMSAMLKKMYQMQIDSNAMMHEQGQGDVDGKDKDSVNLLKKLKIENIELKAQLKQSRQHIEYLETSKIQTVQSMSQEIQRLRQQIIDLSNKNKS